MTLPNLLRAAFAVVVVLPGSACGGSFGLAVTAIVTRDGVVEPDPPSRCTASAGGGLGFFTVDPGNAGVGAPSFEVDVPYDNDTVAAAIFAANDNGEIVGDALVEEEWPRTEVVPGFRETLGASFGTDDIEVIIEGVDGCSNDDDAAS